MTLAAKCALRQRRYQASCHQPRHQQLQADCTIAGYLLKSVAIPMPSSIFVALILSGAVPAKEGP